MTEEQNYPILSTRKLAIGYREGRRQNIILDNLNVSLHAGELVCFMGVNGVGKSTLIRTLAGLQKPLAGDIFYSGESTQNDLPKKLSVVLTDKIAAPTMRVYELISFGRYPYLTWNVHLSEADKQIIEWSIEQVHIDHLRNKSIHELSDGQLQLAMIARALCQDSNIILLDEPTAHLDLSNRIEIMGLLRSLSHSTNKTILIATHDLELAIQNADLIWLAGKNKNILTGIPEDLILNGSFDDVFQFKGFDLKTGKFQRNPYRNFQINLAGNSHYYHWTRNALERTGYSITGDSHYTVTVSDEGNLPRWSVTVGNTANIFENLRDLLIFLSTRNK